MCPPPGLNRVNTSTYHDHIRQKRANSLQLGFQFILYFLYPSLWAVLSKYISLSVNRQRHVFKGFYMTKLGIPCDLKAFLKG